ncbi:hypothetical protein [Streptomyces sp. BA2]|uniref:hypothetical protein n=1 Tax=Streptomyces sp. BA2 TaxID=436595 RepID=UPI00132AD655|nr:hypothetical protein [Streptomyces sp. BA2]MWA16184.1 hypothetical protein [Streptomyces sp. BA2]
MHRVDLAREADQALWAMPDDVHEEMPALIDSVADEREDGIGPMPAAGAALRRRRRGVYVPAGGLLVVLHAGRAG